MLLKLLKSILAPLLFGFIGYALNPFIGNIFTGPIKVSPALIKLKTTIKFPPEVIRRHPFLKDSGSKMEWRFSLINKTSENFYGVWLKLTPVCPDTDPSRLCSQAEIEPLSLDTRYTAPLKTKYFCGDILRFDGIGENGLRSIWLGLYVLEAYEKKSFVLKLPESIISQNQHEPEIRLKTYGRLFEKRPSETPPPFSHKETQPGKGYFTWDFEVPEHIKGARSSPVYVRMKPRKEKRGLEELTDLLSETEQHLEENDQKILASLERIYKRISEGQELSQETIEKKAEKKFEMVRNYNANFLLGEDYEEKGCIGIWFAPLWDGKNTQKFFLADLVGRLDKDRISVFIDKDDLVYQVLTSEGRRETITLDISSWKKGKPQLIMAQWDTNKNWMSLFAGEKDLPSPAQVKEKTVQHLDFDELGPLVFMSIDFEGKYPAKLKPGSVSEVYSLEEQLKRGGWKQYKE